MGTSSKSTSGIESEWWSPESKGEGLVVCVPRMGLLLPEECLKRLLGEHHKGGQPKLQELKYLIYLFPANISSYFLGELQQCLKDPDWLAQLFIKHVRLERV